jgi:hypothetical protein
MNDKEQNPHLKKSENIDVYFDAYLLHKQS